MTTTAQYLRTLRRIPDDIILSIASRDLDVMYRDRCICGWAVREDIARATGRSADDVSGFVLVISESEKRFGGSWNEWFGIFNGVTHSNTARLIEDAFVTRVMEAAGVA